MFRPYKGRELKYNIIIVFSFRIVFRPLQGRELKF